MKSVQEFFTKYVSKVRVFDPLNRPIPNPEVDVATKRDDLVKLVEEMPAIPGKYLVVPLSNDLNRKLENMFTAERKACSEIIDMYYKEAHENADFDGQLTADPKIKEFLDILEFFAKHDLTRTAKKEMVKF
jgi:hypothetical protein